MSSIRGFLKDDDRESPASKYQKLAKGKTNEQKREIESKLLKPEKLPKYTGPPPIKNALDKLTVKMVFPDEEGVALLDKYFKVGSYVEQSVNDITLLIDFLKSLDNGSLEYNKNEGTFRTRPKDSRGKSAVDTRKQGSRNRDKGPIPKSKALKRGS